MVTLTSDPLSRGGRCSGVLRLGGWAGVEDVGEEERMYDALVGWMYEEVLS
jgi:hypothetical protein